MQRINPTCIAITNEEAQDIAHFIRTALERDWDHHTNMFICRDAHEDGVKRMNPEMYELMQKLELE